MLTWLDKGGPLYIGKGRLTNIQKILNSISRIYFSQTPNKIELKTNQTIRKERPDSPTTGEIWTVTFQQEKEEQ